MDSRELEQLRTVKTLALCEGVQIDPQALARLTNGGTQTLSIHEYATTGGLTMELGESVFVNAPFDEWFCDGSPLTVKWNHDTESFGILYGKDWFPARALPLPGYLGARDSKGRLVSEVAMSHADRVRLSLIQGCSMRCRFCDLPNLPYRTHTIEQLIEALIIVKQDRALPVHHILLSGGTGVPRDFPWFDEACKAVIQGAGLPVDIMMTPRRDPNAVDRLFDWGIHGFSINLEVYDARIAQSIIPQKAALGIRAFQESISRAVSLTGGKGRVRSLLVVGLESLDTTLQGVEFLARLGCDPVLSPFRPARGIPLADQRPPSAAFLSELLTRAEKVCSDYGVALGPRCIPCQNNTLTFPFPGPHYYFS